MKKAATKNDGMLPEYDFSNGGRGKHYRQMQQGYTITIFNPDGTITVKHVKPDKDAVYLEPDVKKYFPNSVSVNKALRSLIGIAPRRKEGNIRR
jgi:hypothetical protein